MLNLSWSCVELGLAHELLSNDKYIWQGEWNYLELNPKLVPAHILQIRPKMRREQDFDYFMQERMTCLTDNT